MSKKNRNILIVVIVVLIPVFLMFYANFKSALVRQLQGPIEGTDSVLTVDNKLSVISKNNYVYTWQWKDLSVWPVVTKSDAQMVIPVADDKIIYIPLAGYNGLVLSEFKNQKEIARLDIPYGAEGKKIKSSANGKFGVASVIFKKGVQKDWLKLAVFESDLKGMSFVFQKNTDTENFVLCDFGITNDGNFIVGAGEKGKAWIFAVDVKNNITRWEKTFDEYGRFTVVVFSPDGKTVFVSEKVRHILCFDVSTGEIIKKFEISEYSTTTHQKQNISCIAVSPDGKILAADTEPAQTVWFWDIATGKKISTIHANDLTVLGIAFSPDSKYLATGCMVSPEIKIWKVPQLKP